MLNQSSNSFVSNAIPDGIRRWVEIETPTEAPDQINSLATLVADGQARARLIHRLYQTLR